MKDKTILITGATNGIGAVAARELAGQGARVTIVGRDAKRCQAMVARIQSETGNKGVDALVANLSLRSEVERLTREVKELHPRLDILVNNAGAVFLDRRETPDGLESTFALNHMAYFRLTNGLLDLLKKTPKSRIVNVSSHAHKGGSIRFDDLQMKRKFSGLAAYSQSKLANIHFTTELARRLGDTALTVNSLHPGMVATNFGNDNGWKSKLFGVIFKVFGISPERGARTIVYLASSPDVDGVTGKYFYKEKAVSTSAAAADAADAKRLWEISAQL